MDHPVQRRLEAANIKPTNGLAMPVPSGLLLSFSVFLLYDCV